MLWVLLVIWKVSAEVALDTLTLEQTLTCEAPDLPAALDQARPILATDATITGVVRATCGAVLVWASEPCQNLATRTDGYCDECRDALRECDEAAEDDGSYRIGFRGE